MSLLHEAKVWFFMNDVAYWRLSCGELVAEYSQYKIPQKVVGSFLDENIVHNNLVYYIRI